MKLQIERIASGELLLIGLLPLTYSFLLSDRCWLFYRNTGLLWLWPACWSIMHRLLTVRCYLLYQMDQTCVALSWTYFARFPLYGTICLLRSTIMPWIIPFDFAKDTSLLVCLPCILLINLWCLTFGLCFVVSIFSLWITWKFIKHICNDWCGPPRLPENQIIQPNL